MLTENSISANSELPVANEGELMQISIYNLQDRVEIQMQFTLSYVAYQTRY